VDRGAVFPYAQFSAVADGLIWGKWIVSVLALEPLHLRAALILRVRV
jgi:hypothetical protein